MEGFVMCSIFLIVIISFSPLCMSAALPLTVPGNVVPTGAPLKTILQIAISKWQKEKCEALPKKVELDQGKAKTDLTHTDDVTILASSASDDYKWLQYCNISASNTASPQLSLCQELINVLSMNCQNQNVTARKKMTEFLAATTRFLLLHDKTDVCGHFKKLVGVTNPAALQRLEDFAPKHKVLNSLMIPFECATYCKDEAANACKFFYILTAVSIGLPLPEVPEKKFDQGTLAVSEDLAAKNDTGITKTDVSRPLKPAGAAGGISTGTGSDATGTGVNSTGTGSGATGTGVSSTATGNGATDTGGSSTGTGSDATGTGGNSTGTGSDATGTGVSSTGTGNGATGTGGNSTGTGGSDATGTKGSSSRTGNNATGTGGSSTGTGSDATSTGGNSTGTGNGATGSGGSSTGTGSDATGTGGNYTGTGIQATGSGGSSTGNGGNGGTVALISPQNANLTSATKTVYQNIGSSENKDDAPGVKKVITAAPELAVKPTTAKLQTDAGAVSDGETKKITTVHPVQVKLTTKSSVENKKPGEEKKTTTAAKTKMTTPKSTQLLDFFPKKDPSSEYGDFGPDEEDESFYKDDYQQQLASDGGAGFLDSPEKSERDPFAREPIQPIYEEDKKTEQKAIVVPESSLETHDSKTPLKEDVQSSHFMAYFLTIVVVCIVGYVLFHNKQKIIAFILEGRGNQRRRQQAAGNVEYRKLSSTVDEVLPAADKKVTTQNYIY